MPWSRFWELSLGAVLAYVEFEYAKQLYQFKDSKFYKTVLAIIFRNPSDSDNQKLLKNILVIGLRVQNYYIFFYPPNFCAFFLIFY